MQTQKIVLTDSLTLRDKRLTIPEVTEHRNFLDIFDSNGHHVLRSFNSVVNSGRLFTLGKVFNRDSYGGLLEDELDGKWVSVWAAGTGGISPSTNEPISVELSDIGLSNHQPFIATDSNNSQSNELGIAYWETGSGEKTMYKDFTEVSVFNGTSGNQLLYIEFTLDIEKDELLGKAVSEIATFIAFHTFNGQNELENKSEFQIFSKITFPALPNTEDISNGAGDSYTIKYRVYA